MLDFKQLFINKMNTKFTIKQLNRVFISPQLRKKDNH